MAEFRWTRLELHRPSFAKGGEEVIAKAYLCETTDGGHASRRALPFVNLQLPLKVEFEINFLVTMRFLPKSVQRLCLQTYNDLWTD